MAQVVFGSAEAQAVLERDRPLRAEAAREARIEETRRTGEEVEWEVVIELHRTQTVMACSEDEAWDKAADCLWVDEDVCSVERL